MNSSFFKYYHISPTWIYINWTLFSIISVSSGDGLVPFRIFAKLLKDLRASMKLSVRVLVVVGISSL